MEQQIKAYKQKQDELIIYKGIYRKKCKLSVISKAITRFIISLMVILNVYAAASPVAFTIRQYINDFIYTKKDYGKIIVIDIVFLAVIIIQALIFYCFIRKYPKDIIEQIEFDNDNLIITYQDKSSTGAVYKKTVNINDVHKILEYQKEKMYEIILDKKKQIIIGDYFGDDFRDDIFVRFSDKYVVATSNYR